MVGWCLKFVVILFQGNHENPYHFPGTSAFFLVFTNSTNNPRSAQVSTNFHHHRILKNDKLLWASFKRRSQSCCATWTSWHLPNKKETSKNGRLGHLKMGGVFWKRSFLLETIYFLGGLRVYSMLVFGGVSRNDWRMFEISYRYWVCKITVVFTTQHRSCNFWIAVTAVSLSVHHPISQPPRSSHRNLKQSYPTG